MTRVSTSIDGVGQGVKRKGTQQNNTMNTRRGMPRLLFSGRIALFCAFFVSWKTEELKLLTRWGEDMSSYTKVGAYGEKNFSLVPGPNGMEDITFIFNVEGVGEIFIATADDRMKLWHFKNGGAEHTEDGTLQSILVPVDPNGPVVVRPIKLFGRPKGVAFHPHGLYYLRKTRELFVVNHAYGTEGELVEIFFIEAIHPSPYAKSVNDVVAISSDEIFFTQWLHVGAPAHGFEGAMQQLGGRLNILLAVVLPIPKYLRPPIWRCVTSEKGTNNNNSFNGWACAPVPGTAGLAKMYNGIALSRDKRTLMAADSVGRKILFFNREEGGQLRFKDEIKLPFHPDNIEPSPVYSEELYTVGVTTLQETFEIVMAADSLSSMEELRSTGKVSHGGAIEFSLPEGGYKQQLLTLKSALHCVSCAVMARNGVLLQGSWYAPGILISRP